MSNNANDWMDTPIPEILDRLATDHEWMRENLPQLWHFMEKVQEVHGEHHPEFFKLADVVGPMFQDLESHMHKEENILFPMLRKMTDPNWDGDVASCGGCAPGPAGPMARMLIEHGMANEALAECRKIAMDYKLPEDACKAYTTLYQGLEKLEGLIAAHTDIQENAVHPRITELAAQA